MTTPDLPSRLRADRAAAGLTQRQTAARVGVSQVHICHLESGQKPPTLAILADLAAAYGVPASEYDDRLAARRKRARKA